MDKGRFLQLQNQVRRGDPDAFESIQAMVDKFPEIRDLRFLKAMLIRQRNPESQAARDELAQLQDGVPTFLPPTLFRENVLYALWESDAAIYAQDPSPANRVRLLKSANAYVAAYGHNEPYAEKVRAVRASLGTETR